MAIVEPALSAESSVTEPIKILYRMFNNTVTAEHSQSTLFMGRVVSLKWIISENASNPTSAANLIQVTLENYFAPVFDAVDVRCSVEEGSLVTSESGNVTQYALELDIVVTKNGTRYQLSKSISSMNGDVTNDIYANIDSDYASN